MALFRSVVCAVDLSEHTRGVIYHAAGFAGAAGARLTVLHVTNDRSAEHEADLQRALVDAVPYGATYLGDTSVRLESGEVVETILRVASDRAADLIVSGTHARTGLARLLLGSTGAGLLAGTDRPVLLVASADRDVVTLGADRVGLHFGAVIAAVDLAESSNPHLAVASELAALARQPLLLMTVADERIDDHAAAKELRARGHGLEPAPPHAVIVRRGELAQEIARCAVAESAGLVVMGLREGTGRHRPGDIALEVLQTRHTHVLAVPPG